MGRPHPACRYVLVAIFFTWLSALQVLGLTIQPVPRDDSTPAFLTKSDISFQLSYQALYNPKSYSGESDRKFDNEVFFHDHFARYSKYEEEYMTREVPAGNTQGVFEGLSPWLEASRLPSILDPKDPEDTGEFAYIATETPLRKEEGPNTLYWDMIWQHTGDDVVLVSLLRARNTKEPHGPKEPHRNLIPFEEGVQKTFPAIDPNTGEELDKIKYTLDFVTYHHYLNQNLLYWELKLTRDHVSRTVHFFWYTSWKSFGTIPNDQMSKLILEVNRLSCGGPVVVNCRAGLGRTGEFIVMRELYLANEKARLEGKNWFKEEAEKESPRGSSFKNDPILNYVERLRRIRGGMIDDVSQWIKLYGFAKDLYDSKREG